MSPVLLLHGRCDERTKPFSAPEPACRPQPDQFPQLSSVIPVSSQHPLGLDVLRPHLCEAIKALLQAHPQPPLPTSWARVRQVIRDMQERKTPRTVSQAEFQALCDSSGCGSNAAVLRTALHQMGVIFYREGVFDDLIIIDQSWVLDKVYTVFDRTRTNFLREVRDKHGRFRRSDLQRFFWQNDSVAEQQVYLGFMESCGICFRADEGSERDDGALYLAPDMLPEWDDGPREEYMGWPQKPDAGVTASFSVLHDGIARGFLSRIGRRTGMRADYWRFGCHFRDRATGSEVLIRTSGNAFRLEARGGAATEVLGILLDVLRRMPTRQPLTETWDARDTPPPAAHECTDGDPVDRLDPEPRSGLAGLFGGNRRMGDDDIGDIRSIYLMGCAFRVGAQSQNEAGKLLLKLKELGLFKKKVAVSPSSLTGVVKRLEAILDQHLVYEVDTVEGQYALTPAGERTCREAEALLRPIGELPEWSEEAARQQLPSVRKKPPGRRPPRPSS